MNALFSSLGIEWKVLLAQIVNFAILAILLQKFLYKPVLKMLADRRQKIEDGERKATEIDQRLAEVEAQQTELLKEGREKANLIIKEAQQVGERLKEQSAAEARKEAESIANFRKKQLEEAERRVRTELKKEIGVLVADAIEKTLGDVLDAKTQAKLQEQAVQTAVGATHDA